MHAGTSKERAGAGVVLGLGMVLFAAIAVACATLADYASAPWTLWQDVLHDRNGHFAFALDLALALRDLDLLDFFTQLEKSKTWPPVHGLALASVMLLGGIDVKLAIVPSLAGWVATIVLIWLISVRLFADRLSAVTAGAVAVAFAIASPSLRLITADVMLEGLGGALSALCLYAYLRARETPAETGWWRVLAIALTVLFLEKANYWVLTIVPLVAAFVLDERRTMPAFLAWLRRLAAAARARDLARDPLLILFLIVASAVVAIAVHGPWRIQVFGRDISLYPPNNLLTVAWWLLFARLVLAWKRNRSTFELAIGAPVRQLVYWHALPMAVSFLLPQRLSVFLWFVGPTHHHGRPYSPLQAALGQWLGFSEGFHVHPWAAGAAIAGVLLALARLHRLGPPVRTVALVALFGAAAVVLHPQQQLRFQTTVLYAWWILAGAGWSALLALISGRLQPLRWSIAAAGLAALVIAQARQPWSILAHRVAIHPLGGVSDIEVYRVYAHYLDPSRIHGVLSTSAGSPFFRWTVRHDCKCRVKVDQPFLPTVASREEMRSATAAWLARTPADLLVAIDMPEWHLLYTLGLDPARGQLDALAGQSRFQRIKTIPAPIGAGTISIWSR